MALTPPTVGELADFRMLGDFAQGAETEQVTVVLQQATDALWLFTGIEEYPADSRASRVVKNAIMDLSLWLMSQIEHRDEINSPFSSERIGSYSYSKMQSSSRGEDTGIYWLDLMFRMLRNDLDSGMWSSSERVFNPLGLTFAENEYYEKLDRSNYDLFGF